MSKVKLICFLLLFFSFSAQASALPIIKIDEDREIELQQAVQIWNVTQFSTASNSASRNDTILRRGRTSLQGRFAKDVSFRLGFAYDGIGKDPLNWMAFQGQTLVLHYLTSTQVIQATQHMIGFGSQWIL